MDKVNYELSQTYSYHGGKQHILLSETDIDPYLIQSVGEIDIQIENHLKEESGKILLRIENIFIESYTYRRTNGGSYIPTPKKLANTKCTINPDNSDIIDLATGKPTDNCLKGALGYYFADKDRITDHLRRCIYREKSLRKYLD